MKHDICYAKQSLIAGCAWVTLSIFLFSMGTLELLWGQYITGKLEGVSNLKVYVTKEVQEIFNLNFAIEVLLVALEQENKIIN